MQHHGFYFYYQYQTAAAERVHSMVLYLLVAHVIVQVEVTLGGSDFCVREYVSKVQHAGVCELLPYENKTIGKVTPYCYVSNFKGRPMPASIWAVIYSVQFVCVLKE